MDGTSPLDVKGLCHGNPAAFAPAAANHKTLAQASVRCVLGPQRTSLFHIRTQAIFQVLMLKKKDYTQETFGMFFFTRLPGWKIFGEQKMKIQCNRRPLPPAGS